MEDRELIIDCLKRGMNPFDIAHQLGLDEIIVLQTLFAEYRRLAKKLVN